MTTPPPPLLLQILPRSIYQLLSDTYHSTLQYAHGLPESSSNLMSLRNIESSTLRAMQWGLVVGIGLVSYLELFPGEPNMYGSFYNSEQEQESKSKEKQSSISRDNTDRNTTTPTSSTSSTRHDSNEWAGDSIPSEKLDALRSKMGLSEEQMKQVMQRSKEHFLKGGGNENDGGGGIASVFQTLNRLVYLGLFMGIIYIFNRDYDNVVTVWFVHTFPREARTLGIHL